MKTLPSNSANRNDSRVRRLDALLRVADGGTTVAERSAFQRRAEELAQRYGLSEFIEHWTPEGTAPSQTTSNSVVCEGESVGGIQHDDETWMDVFASHTANAHHLSVVKRHPAADDTVNVGVYYDFIGDSESGRWCAQACQRMSVTMHSLFADQTIDRDLAEPLGAYLSELVCGHVESGDVSPVPLSQEDRQRYDAPVEKKTVSTSGDIDPSVADLAVVEMFLATGSNSAHT